MSHDYLLVKKDEHKLSKLFPEPILMEEDEEAEEEFLLSSK